MTSEGALAPAQARSTLVFAAAVGLSLGFADAAYVLLSSAHELDPFSAIPTGVLAVAVAAFVLSATLLFTARAALGRIDADPAGLASAVALIVCTAFLALEKPIELRLSPEAIRGLSPRQAHAVELVAVVFFVLLAALGAYAAARVLRRRGGLDAAAKAAFLTPVLIAELTLVLWIGKARPSIRLRGAALLFLAAAALTVLLARGRSGLARAERLVLGASALLVLAAGISSVAPLSRAESAPGGRHAVRHIVLISVDTLRADALGSTGGPAGQTPALDRFAAESALFKSAISPAPWTLPSLASILTGVSPAVHEFHLVARSLFGETPESWRRIPTLAERARDAGYTTAAFIANSIVGPGTNITRGFQECLVTPTGTPRERRSLGGRLISRPRYGELPPGKSARMLTSLAESWLSKNRTEDFFLWVHYFDPHLPYRLPPEYQPALPLPPRVDPSSNLPGTVRDAAELTWRRAMYAAEARFTDDEVGKLLAALKRLGIYDDSLVVFTADHGEGFLEHGLMTHGNSLYQEVLHVPLIVKLPGRKPPHVIETPVDTTSIAPTVLELCGLRWTPASMTSPSLVPLVREPAPGTWPPIVSTGLMSSQEKESVVLGRWKYIRESATGAEEIYDLAQDPGERSPLATSPPETLAAARSALRVHHDAAERLRRSAPAATRTKDEDQETVRRLKALGYIQ